MMNDLDSRFRGNDNEGTACRALTSRRWVEWAAVLGCVGFGLAILFPAAGLARGGGKAQVCLANVHLMMRSWLAYAEDNDSQIVGSATYEWNGWQSRRYPAWAPTTTRSVKNFVGLPHNETHTPSFVALADEIRGIQQGGLWPYLETERVYHCPSDTRYLKQSRYGSWGGYRSYSIGCPLNGYAIGDGWATGEYYAAVYKTNEITSPGTKIVFVEEMSALGYNDNAWDIFLSMATFPNFWPGDSLACVHNQRSTLGFADGHTEQHLWQDQAVIKTFTDQVTNGSNPPSNPQYLFGPNEGADLCWFVRHYVPREPQPGTNFYPLPR
jgi:prepilin-type processing-associated H-X9-DG protein